MNYHRLLPNGYEISTTFENLKKLYLKYKELGYSRKYARKRIICDLVGFDENDYCCGLYFTLFRQDAPNKVLSRIDKGIKISQLTKKQAVVYRQILVRAKVIRILMRSQLKLFYIQLEGGKNE